MPYIKQDERGFLMIAERPINISEEYRKIALQGEPILDNSQDLVIISMKNYEEMVKAKHNAEYMAEIDKRVERLARGEGIHKTMEELRAMENE
ncbi:MAG: hypothetical protein NC548_36140 [Lachnospiraceae bacterium]|nr:hypothetical protein [Lachnospiraceae bacterium]